MSDAEEDPKQPEFRGVWIHAHVFELLEQNTLSPREAILLAWIEAFSKGRRGCFAGNQFFADKTGITRGQISEIISHLKELGLVKISGFNGRKRMIKAVIPEDPVEIQPTGKPVSSLREKPDSHTGENRTYSNTDTNNNRTVSRGVSRLSSGFLNTDHSNGEQVKDSRKFAEKLYNALSAKNKVMRRPDLNAWDRTFSKFIQETQISLKRLSTVFDWYCSHICYEFVPRAFSAETFCEEFIRIEDAMDRAAPSEDEVEAEREQKWQEWQRINEEVGALYVQVYQPEDGETIDKEKKEQLKKEHFPQYDHISLLERPR